VLGIFAVMTPPQFSAGSESGSGPVDFPVDADASVGKSKCTEVHVEVQWILQSTTGDQSA